LSPLRESRSLTERYREEIQVETLKRYYLIFEGTHTEVKYFEGVENYRKYLGINNMIETVILHKEGEIESHSHPRRLLDLINGKKVELKERGNYEEGIDEFVIIFDRDSFRKDDEYKEFVSLAELDNILAVTSPCFELWLILHSANSVEEVIVDNEKQILKNERVSTHHTYTSQICSKLFGINPKSNLDFEIFKENLDIAILQEKKLTREYLEYSTRIGSNIGELMELLRADPREKFLE
jgi:hypothetical protein